MPLKIDHVVVGATQLKLAGPEMKELMGVSVPPGGKHPAMSTHNQVMQSGNDTFFEIIAIDPNAPAFPGRIRWFTLDEARTQHLVVERSRALSWVVGTDDLDAVIAASPIDLGEAVPLTRDDMSWRLTVRKDGSLPMDGLVPGFIQWPPGPLPCTRMPDLGVRLNRVRLSYPDPEELLSTLKALRVDHLAEIVEGEQGLAFVLDTPKGEVIID